MVKKFLHTSILFLIIAVTFVATTAITSVTANAQANTFPSIHIVVPQCPFVYRDLWLNGTISVTGAPEGQNFEPVDARTRGRGNSTWIDGSNKRPLRFTLDEARSMLGSEYEAREWILLADNFDRSLMRNYAAFQLGAALGGMTFVPSGRHVHLYVNEQYMGIYLLTDERNNEPGRLTNVQHDPDPAISGFIIELDSRAWHDDAILNVDFLRVNHRLYDIRFPRSSDMTPAHIEYLQNYMDSVSRAIRFGTFDEIESLIDIESFVNFYIVQEIMKNPDVDVLSNWMHISGEGDSRRLFKGPIWDFDMAGGNRPGLVFGDGPEGLFVGTLNYWFRYLLERPEFAYAVATRWAQARSNEIAEVINDLRVYSNDFRHEFDRNFERHPFETLTLGGTPQTRALHSFELQADLFLSWLEARVDWLDDVFMPWLYLHMHFGLNVGHVDLLWDLVQYHQHDLVTVLNVDGKTVNPTFHPINLRNRNLMEVGDIARILGADFSFCSGEVFITYGNMRVDHFVGSDIYYINGIEVVFDSPSYLIRDYVFIPVRVIVEGFGYTVNWSDRHRIISIFTE